MSDPFDAQTPSANEVEPDPQDPEDAAGMQAAGDLDEDELAADPLEEGIEPPERWSTVTEGRPRPRDERQTEPLEERLTEERPDVDTRQASQPLTETRVHELDESVDERAGAEVADGVDPGEDTAPVESRHGAVLEGDETEPTGLSATTAEGADVDSDEITATRAPEEGAERVEDGER